MTREQYEYLLSLLKFEIRIHERCIAECNPALAGAFKAKLKYTTDTEHELSRLFFSQLPTYKVTFNGTSEKSECQAAQAA